ncbi:hypothetical protein RFI_03459 [Reticulomyxa filosa]|uniref:Uncharacterized protein n=1 Tax=Reticulomyxa filosa TaxID=46433 RepID=X6P7M9_RETFI|nr:hypothetical protein RFI_03459 [Reticulomyxa filosa]|eukprot:ETO33642.1 hypothetical protein RFI_03459 [Reticulomyxa filosa]
MSKHWGVNVLNSVWIVNLDIFVFNCVIPVYSMKAARLLARFTFVTQKKKKKRGMNQLTDNNNHNKHTHSILTYKRDFLNVARILIYPNGFMTLITLFYSFTEDFRVLSLILSVWCLYQTFLLWQAIRQNCVRMLPLFQLLQGGLRAEAHRRRHSSHIRDMTKMLTPPEPKEKLHTIDDEDSHKEQSPEHNDVHASLQTDLEIMDPQPHDNDPTQKTEQDTNIPLHS